MDLGILGQELLDKLKSHPLIQFETDKETWKFGEEQIRTAILADRLVGHETTGI